MAQLGRSYTRPVVLPRPEWPYGVDVSTGATLTVTATITATGIVGGPSPVFVVNEAAITTAELHYRGVGKGIPNRPVYTWRSSLADVAGQGTANLAVTAAITADGTVTVLPSPAATYVVNAQAVLSSLLARIAGIGYPNVPIWSRSSSADVPNAGSANLAVTVGIVTDGIVSASGPPYQVVNDQAILTA